ncbi:TolC family protein [Novosphingobium colocasiae]|nr:TolC family protein [Novosphingobium colocasiae]
MPCRHALGPSFRAKLRLKRGAMALALVMGGMQPTIAATPAAATLLQTPAPPPPPETALWWHSAGDAVLDQLIERGLATDKPLACEAQALHRDGGKARTRDKRLDRRIARLFGAAGAEADSADLQARAYDYADHRARLAARIAATYLDVRRLQEIATLRRKMQAQFKDNAEIARFRREAGLVDGLDVGLAGSLVAINGSSLDADRQTFEDKARELADLTGMDETTLLASLGEEGKVPDLTIAAAAMPADKATPPTGIALYRADLAALERRLTAGLLRDGVGAQDIASALSVSGGDAGADEKAALAARSLGRLRAAENDARAQIARERDAMTATAARLATLDRKARDSRATAASARVAYRNGMVPFSALYAAEAAGSGLSEAGIGARATLAGSAVRLARALGLGWVTGDLQPGPVGISSTEVLVCE